MFEGFPLPPLGVNSDRYFDRQGNKISFERFIELSRSGVDPRVALTKVRGFWVSTLWFGVNVALRGFTPAVFETMIFDGPLDGFQARYPTEIEALEGHEVAVKMIKALPRQTLIKFHQDYLAENHQRYRPSTEFEAEWEYLRKRKSEIE